MRFAAVEREQDERYVLECDEDDDEGADRRDFATTPAAAGVMQAEGELRCLDSVLIAEAMIPQTARWPSSKLPLTGGRCYQFKFFVVQIFCGSAGGAAAASQKPAGRRAMSSRKQPSRPGSSSHQPCQPTITIIIGTPI